MTSSEPALSAPVTRRSRLVVAMQAVVTLVLIAIILSRQGEFAAVSSMLAKANLAHLLVVLVGMYVSVALVTARWWLVIAANAGRAAAVAPLFRGILVGLFFNQVLPTGVGGDLLRIRYAMSAGLGVAKSFATVAVDRLLGCVAILAFMIGALPWLMSLDRMRPAQGPLALTMGVAALGMALVAGADRLVARLPLLRHGLLGRGAAALAEVARDSRRIACAQPAGAAALAISLLNQLLLGWLVFVIGRALGAELAWWQAVLLWPPVTLVSMLPISLSGWGVREGASVLFLAGIGVPSGAAIAISVIFGVGMLVAGLPGGAVWIHDLRARQGGGGGDTRPRAGRS